MFKRRDMLIYTLMLFIVSAFFVSNYLSGTRYNSNQGRSLAYYDFYPILSDSNGEVFLDGNTLNEAIIQLSSQVVDNKASGDLIRLIEQNSASFLIDPINNEKAAELSKVSYHPENDNENFLITLKSIVHGMGRTLAGTPIEIVLHDTRNPMKSVIAIENPVTGRKIHSKNTNFGVELIKKYARNEIQNGNIVAYPITLPDGRLIKATTIPIYDDGELIAFICINIDTSKISIENSYELQKVIDKLVNISPQESYYDIEELIKPLSKEKIYMNLDRLRFELEKPLLVIKENKGILACAYINHETCNKTGEACAIVSGVGDYDDMMEAKVIAISDKAKDLGVKVGDTGLKALEKFK